MSNESIDIEVLTIALTKVTDALDTFISECMADDGASRSPSHKALMQARACLPVRCVNAQVRNDNMK